MYARPELTPAAERAQRHLDGLRAWARERVAAKSQVTLLDAWRDSVTYTYKASEDCWVRYSVSLKSEKEVSEAEVLRAITEAAGVYVEASKP